MKDKVIRALESLSDVDAGAYDIFESIGVVTDDLRQVLESNDILQFRKEKIDLVRSLRFLIKEVKRLCYKDIKVQLVKKKRVTQG